MLNRVLEVDIDHGEVVVVLQTTCGHGVDALIGERVKRNSVSGRDL